MKNQIIVSISREYGSGGHEIAEMVSKKMGLKLYDKNILKEIAEKNNIALTELKEFDEKDVYKRQYIFTAVPAVLEAPAV